MALSNTFSSFDAILANGPFDQRPCGARLS